MLRWLHVRTADPLRLNCPPDRSLSFSDRAIPWKGASAPPLESTPKENFFSPELWTGAPRVFTLLWDTTGNPLWALGWSVKMLHQGDLQPRQAKGTPGLLNTSESAVSRGWKTLMGGWDEQRAILSRQWWLFFFSPSDRRYWRTLFLCSVMEWHSRVSLYLQKSQCSYINCPFLFKRHLIWKTEKEVNSRIPFSPKK